MPDGNLKNIDHEIKVIEDFLTIIVVFEHYHIFKVYEMFIETVLLREEKEGLSK